MQVQGKDTIIETYIGTNGQQLNLTTTGYQFGANKDRSLVTSIEQIIGPDSANPLFPKSVQDKVEVWLSQNGPTEARQQLVDREVAEKADEQPGSLDAMAKQLGPAVTSQLFQMLKAAIRGEAIAPPSPTVGVEQPTAIIDGVPVVEDAKGIKHRLPDPELAKNPKVIPVDGGVLLDKGNGHKEFVPGFDGTEDESVEEAILADRSTRKKR